MTWQMKHWPFSAYHMNLFLASPQDFKSVCILTTYHIYMIVRWSEFKPAHDFYVGWKRKKEEELGFSWLKNIVTYPYLITPSANNTLYFVCYVCCPLLGHGWPRSFSGIGWPAMWLKIQLHFAAWLQLAVLRRSTETKLKYATNAHCCFMVNVP